MTRCWQYKIEYQNRNTTENKIQYDKVFFDKRNDNPVLLILNYVQKVENTEFIKIISLEVLDSYDID